MVMDKRISQPIMVWFLPIVIIGGLFFPPLGFIVFGMMVFFIILSYSRGRFWCSHLCPRGSFLDLILSKVSSKSKMPGFLLSPKVKWSIFFAFMAFFMWQLVVAPKNFYAVGFVFVRMCLITTLIAIVIGIPTHHRMWCAVCPMGTLQGKIGSMRKRAKGDQQSV